MNSMHAATLVAAMSVMTMLTRFLPFIVLSKNTPRYITYLG
jgi:branched-subunit amino acid transport protein AzlD